MPKFYASGWNGNGFLGLGDATNRSYFTEGDLSSLGIKSFVRSPRTTDRGHEAMFAIMSDGSLYGWGGGQAQIKTPTLMNNSHVYVEGWWEETNNQLNNTTKYLVLLADDGYLYRAAVTDATNSLTCSVSILSDNTNFAWLGVKLTHMAAAYHYGTGAYGGNYIVATDGRYLYVAIGGTTVLPAPSIYSLSGIEKIVVGDVAVNPYLGFFGAYLITSNKDLYCWTPSAQSDQFNIFSTGTTPTVPTLYLSNIIDADIGYGIVGVLTTDHTLKVWGYEHNGYASPSTNPTSYADASQYNDVVRFSTSSHYGCVYLDSTGTLYAWGIGQYGRLGLGNTTNYGTPQAIITKTFNTNSALYLTALATFVAEPSDVTIDVTFWNPDGTGEVGFIEGVKSIKQMTVGSYFPVPINLIDIDDETHQVNLQYGTNREFLGLATSAGGSVVYAAGGSYDVSFSSNTDLYIVLGDIPSGDGFDVTFYRCSAEKNRVNKSAFLTSALSVKAILRERSSIYKPQILIELFSVPIFNYCYIPAFQRYYWITDITSVNNGLWLISMSCDPLMTFKSAILASPFPVVARSADSTHQNALLPDGKMVRLSTKIIEEEEITNNVLMKNLTNLSNIYMLSVISSADSYVQIMPVSASPTMFVYDGSAHIPTFNLSLNGGGLYAVTGTTTAQTNKGVYSTTFTPATGVYWSDNHGSEARSVQWRIYDPNETGQFFIVVYNKDYLPYPPDATIPRGQAYTIPSGSSYEPVRQGYTFTGWKDGSTGTIYQPGDVFTPNANMNLTAQWA